VPRTTRRGSRAPSGRDATPLDVSDWLLVALVAAVPAAAAEVARMRGRAVWVASAEDIIVYKLVSGRDRDLMDIRQIVKRQTQLDRPYLKKWTDWWEEQGVKKISEKLEALFSAAE